MNLTHVTSALLASAMISSALVSQEQAVISPQAHSPVYGTGAADSGLEYTSKKSVLLAIGLSLALPGMGELYAGNFETGKYFLVADGILWLAYAAFELHSDWVMNDARQFALQHSGANFAGATEQYEVDIGNYRTVQDYNQDRLRNRETGVLYDPATYGWSWDTDVNRSAYRDLRVESDESARNGNFVIAALVLNRIISAISAARAAGSHNARIDEGADWNLRAGVQGGLFHAHGIELRFSTSF
jgi:hypothetical protein